MRQRQRLDLPSHRLFGQSSITLRPGQHQRCLHTDDELSRPSRNDDAHRRRDNEGEPIVMLRRIYQRLISRRGATSVEFAIVAMPCLMLIFAMQPIIASQSNKNQKKDLSVLAAPVATRRDEGMVISELMAHERTPRSLWCTGCASTPPRQNSALDWITCEIGTRVCPVVSQHETVRYSPVKATLD
jgi:hypothetical protein